MEEPALERNTPTGLEEVAETDARGEVAAVYAEVRAALGMEAVVLYYRALAARPGRLERVWAAVGPNLRTAAARAEAAALSVPALPLPTRLPTQVLACAGVDPAALRATVAAFDRANRLNAVVLTGLLDGVPGDPSADAAAAPPLVASRLPPMADLAALPPPTRSLLERMSAPIAGAGPPVVVPSLFRFLAHDAALLEAVWARIRPQVESAAFEAAAGLLAGQARDAARRLPFPIPREADDEVRELTARFIRTIPAMILVCSLLRAALGEDGTLRCPA